MITSEDEISLLNTAIEKLLDGFRELPAMRDELHDCRDALLIAADRMHDNFPYFHPLYAGQMLKPPHPVARLAYSMAMVVNPNNHALDGGRASSAMEKEAVGEIAAMFGWTTYLGHLCGGGTMANLEALWIAREITPGKAIAASSQAHYTHSRLSGVLGVPFASIPCDRFGRMDLDALEDRLKSDQIGAVVATLGTTATGAIDPLPDILALRDKYGFRLHVDAAYGGYFTLAGNIGPEARGAFDRIGEVDSIVIDPHKHGLQPYGCGCILFKDPSVGRVYKHDSPYTYFSSDELHLGEISLECSRPGASAVALWTTQRLLPLVQGGEFAAGLEKSREAAMALYKRLQSDSRFVTAFTPELDIVIWLPRADFFANASAHSKRIFNRAAEKGLHLALADLPIDFFSRSGMATAAEKNSETVLCLRSVLMKPQHLEWLDRIWEIISTTV